MGEKWGKMGNKWVKNELTGVEKTVLMHASAQVIACIHRACLGAGVDMVCAADIRYCTACAQPPMTPSLFCTAWMRIG